MFPVDICIAFPIFRLWKSSAILVFPKPSAPYVLSPTPNTSPCLFIQTLLPFPEEIYLISLNPLTSDGLPT